VGTTDEEKERERESGGREESFCRQLTTTSSGHCAAIWRNGSGPAVFKHAGHCTYFVHHTCHY